MAERRMFAKTIIDSDAFLDMPLSTQALYFHLSMRADDDGFINNPKKIQRMIGASDDDLKLLIAKNFIIPFESGIVVIKHWKIHNYIRGDRKKETVYHEEMALLDSKDNGAYTLINDIPLIEVEDEQETLRQKVYKESSLPYSFNYKIRNAFVGKKCPICECTMSHSNNLVRPTIQHNLPISKGGLHELGNISVICSSCNSSIRDNETEKLNAEEVIEVWDVICQSSVSQMSVSCHTQYRLGKSKDSIEIGKDSIENNIVIANANDNVSKSQLEEEFETIWKEYPRKQGKANALKSYIKSRKKGTTYEEVLLGLENYVYYITIEKIDSKYIKQGSTWFNQECWNDDYTIKREVTTADLNIDCSDFFE